jgi:hypothetical protein
MSLEEKGGRNMKSFWKIGVVLILVGALTVPAFVHAKDSPGLPPPLPAFG